jgi:hypothetical protein
MHLFTLIGEIVLIIFAFFVMAVFLRPLFKMWLDQE